MQWHVVVIQLPCVHVAMLCMLSATVCVCTQCVCVERCLVLGMSLGMDWGTCSVDMASFEPRAGEPLLIGQLHLCVSLYGTFLCQADITDHSHYTHICACGHVRIYTCCIASLHITTTTDHPAPMLATTQHWQEAFIVRFTVITVYSCAGYVHYVHSSVYSCNS